MRSVVIVAPQPLGCLILRLLKRLKQGLIEAFIAHGSVKAFNIGVLLRFAWLDINQHNAFALRPLLVVVADEFRAVVRADELRCAAPLNQLVKVARECAGRNAEVDFSQQTFSVVVVNDVATADAAPIAQVVVHEVNRPCNAHRRWHFEWLRHGSIEAFLRRPAQIELELAVDAVHAFVVVFPAQHMADVQET